MHPPIVLRFFHAMVMASLTLTLTEVKAVSGIQASGFGFKSTAMGGATIALPSDAMAGATNPAAMAFVPSQVTGGLVWVHQQTRTEFTSPFNTLNSDIRIAAPELGFNLQANSTWTFGAILTGQGSKVDYQQAMLPFPGLPVARAELKVMELAPVVSFRPTPDLALGFGLNLVQQSLDLQGQVVAAPFPPGIAVLPAHGKSSATGVGARLGLLWQVAPGAWLGASYKSRTRMGRLDGYAGDVLVTGNGRIDVPAQFGVGVSFQPVSGLTFAMDLARIQWAGIRVLQDPTGFYWKNQSVLHLGASYDIGPAWTLRAGASHGSRQLRSSNVAQNALVPATSQTALTFGASYRWPTSELGFAVEVNPRKTVVGSGPSAGSRIANRVNIVKLGYEYRF